MNAVCTSLGACLLLGLKYLGITLLSCAAVFWLTYLVSPADRRKVMLTKWKAFGHGIGVFISRFLLTFLYFTVIAFFAILRRIAADDLRMRGRYTWIPRATRDLTIEDAKGQG